jgi:hypothetical protein
MNEDLQKKINEAFDGILDEEIAKAQENDLPDKDKDEDEDEDMIEKAFGLLKKGNYKNDDEMIGALQKAGYNKAVCKKAMNKFKSENVKKAIDDHLEIEEETNSGDVDELIDVSALMEEIPNMFKALDGTIAKGVTTNLAIAKALKIIGHAVVDNREKMESIYDMVKAIGNNPIVKGVKGGVIERKFDNTQQDVKKSISDTESLEIQNALLKIGTQESHEVLRRFSVTRDIDLIKGFKNEIEKSIGKELKF